MMVSYRCRSGCRYCFLFFGAVLHFVSFHFMLLLLSSSMYTCIVPCFTGTVCVAWIVICTAMCECIYIYINIYACYLWTFLLRSIYVPVQTIHTCLGANRQVYVCFIFGRFNELFHFNLNFVAYVQ